MFSMVKQILKRKRSTYHSKTIRRLTIEGDMHCTLAACQQEKENINFGFAQWFLSVLTFVKIF